MDMATPYVESMEEKERRLGQERRNGTAEAHKVERRGLEALRKGIKGDDEDRVWNAKYTAERNAKKLVWKEQCAALNARLAALYPLSEAETTMRKVAMAINS